MWMSKIKASFLAVLCFLVILGSNPVMADDAADHRGMCLAPKDENYCQKYREKFKEEFVDAYKGNYQAQRNVSFCLSTGCDGAVRENKILGCAWRIVIVKSGSSKVDSTDTGNLNFYCGRLQKVELEAATAQAEQIRKKIK